MSRLSSDQPPASIIDNRSSIIDFPTSHEPSIMSQSKRVSALSSQLSALRSYSGFTSVELIIVMLVLGMLTVAFVFRNPFTTGDYSTIAADQLIADIKYVQMRAMGIGSSQSINFTNNSREYTISGESETRRLPDDRSGNPVIKETNFGNILCFNSLGEPGRTYSAGPPTSCLNSCNSANGCTISIGTTSTIYRTIKVYAITGKVE